MKNWMKKQLASLMGTAMLFGALSLPTATPAFADDYLRGRNGRILRDSQGRPMHTQGAGKSVAIIGGTTAGGAIIGGLTGGTKGALIGGAAGAAGGYFIDRNRRNGRKDEIRDAYYNQRQRGYSGGRSSYRSRDWRR